MKERFFLFAVSVLTIWFLGHYHRVLANETDQPDFEIGELEQLPEVKLTPDLPFYFLKTIWEEIRLSTVRDIEKKIRLQLEFAEKRLAEALKEAEKEKYHIVDKLMVRYEDILEEINAELKTNKDDKIISLELVENIKESVNKEQAVLKVIEKEAQKGDQETIKRAKIMKNRGIYKGQNRLKELFTLKVTSENYEPPFLTPVPFPINTERATP